MDEKMPARRRTGDLTSGPIPRTLLLFALPVLGSNVLQSLNGSVNAVWVGRFLGESALTATSNANLVLFLILGTVFGIGMAATILVAQSVGARDLPEARRIVGTSATFFFLVSVVFAVFGWIWVDAILGALGTPADALPLARSYLRIIFVAVPMMNLLSFVMTVLRGAGDSRTPFIFMALAVVLDIVLNPLLIRGIGPFPELGIAGSATSTLIGQTVSVIAILVVLYARKHPLRLAGANLALLRPDPALLRIVVFKGVPMGLQMIVISAAALTVMGIVNSYGSQVAAAYGIAAQLWTYIQMPALAIGAAVSSMAAQNVGAGRWDRIGRVAASGVGFNLVLTGALVALLWVFDRSILGLFLSSDSAAIDIAAHINTVASWSFILFGITIVLFATVRATGAVMPPLIILVISVLVVRTGFAYYMRGVIGEEALWWSFPAGSIASLVLAAAYYRFGGWRSLHMIENRPAAGEPPDTGLGMPRQRANMTPETPHG
ncbi:MATE family efflux transporter [Mesorhizobium sp. M8A.F.Ca.ET.202.01.1.1]|nr:MATE family efflux transporter [Mesorhizobium sp. M8A.F.Ca.ET.197.01.1.1]TGR26385.1 MATE family efflux transporter [Mesorhizobium sp. M8A.F.Ca.ET.202.01.1.1]TGR41209.1 MATE family efflux transporter [bacterium M00.F.Ca.ET.199.01.1.1]TGR50701.1 MATE family efflux transporter [Mesorhizobium sp. M8A.F.Ca.ET.198.01.1.1]TGU32054.1 MATE family efflux transporter [bacterium M00.F.Ca.ET.156.01.1.1]TGV86146.1 MATE family efflux transporter [Mesorhizobium sp. M00.F.Ca.ET.149.01.1.1]